MILLDFYKQHNKPTVICLGRFDGLHLGHLSLIERAKQLKLNSSNAVDVCVFSFFKSEPISRLNTIFTQEEALFEIEKTNADAVIYAYQTQDFYNTTAIDFLTTLKNNFSPVAIICGDDYTFGKNKSGNVEFLQTFCNDNDINLVVTPMVTIDGNKVASTFIKECLAIGDIERANLYLGKKYYMSGIIMQGRGDGSKLGFATANINAPDKMPIKNGVYLTKALLDGKLYDSITNYGTAPTFGDEKVKIETHILGEFDNLYGKKITIYFDKFLRETKKFDTVDQLKAQIKKDLSIYD